MSQTAVSCCCLKFGITGNHLQACLWYSWQKTPTETAVVRECFAPSILLGSVEDPLVPMDTCQPKDISEEDQKVAACLCTSDRCNSYR